jgi:hypothetical protein
MSADDRSNGRKTLSPEVLPAPVSGAALTPQARVAERARLLLQRFRGVGTMAGAAVLSVQCSGYAVVDPLPPPPMQCTVSSNPFTQLVVSGLLMTTVGSPPPVTLILQDNHYPHYIGFRVDGARVTNGTLVSITDMSHPEWGGGSLFHVTVAPASATAELLIDVDLGCGAAVATRRYRIVYRVPATAGESINVEEVVLSSDGGTD